MMHISPWIRKSALFLSVLLSHLTAVESTYEATLLHNVGDDPECESGTGSDNTTNDPDSPRTTAPYSLSTPTWTVPATGTGTAYAIDCNSESQIYESVLRGGLSQYGEQKLITSTRLSTNWTAPITTLCDGRTRLLGSLTAVASGTYLWSDWPDNAYTGPAPSCSIQPLDCAWLQSSFLTRYTSYWQAWSLQGSRLTDFPPSPPACSINGLYNPACGQCTINGGSVKLFYFPPPSTAFRDMCVTKPYTSTLCPFGATFSNNDTQHGFATAPCPYISTSTTVTTDSGPSTIINSTTFYLNRAYISYETLFATNKCGHVGREYSDSLIAIPSSDIYSLSGYHFGLTHAAYSFNFADLRGPVPASAYLCQPNCDNSDGNLGFLGDGDIVNGVALGRLGFCSTIIDQGYRPILAVPPQMRGIDPEWKDCLLGLDGLYDPPMALAEQTSVDGVTVPSGASYTPRPASTPTTNIAGITTPRGSPTNAASSTSLSRSNPKQESELLPTSSSSSSVSSPSSIPTVVVTYTSIITTSTSSQDMTSSSGAFSTPGYAFSENNLYILGSVICLIFLFGA